MLSPFKALQAGFGSRTGFLRARDNPGHRVTWANARKQWLTRSKGEGQDAVETGLRTVRTQRCLVSTSHAVSTLEVLPRLLALLDVPKYIGHAKEERHSRLGGCFEEG